MDIVRGGFRWQIADDFVDRASLLLGNTGLRLAEWLAEGRASLVKQTPHRAVYRVVLPEVDLHVKHYRGEWRDWPRRLFRPSRARREYLLGRMVAERGLPTLDVLACGDASLIHSLDSFLITRTLPDSISLLDFLQSEFWRLPQPQRERLRQQLARKIGQLLARMHQASIRHQDLHAGNLLLRFQGEIPELFLIDLGYVQLGAPLDWPASRDNLSMLDRWFAPRWSRTDRRRACRAYCQMRPDIPLPEKQVAFQVEQLTHAWMLGQIDHATRRTLGGNRHFRRIIAGTSRGYAATDVDHAALAELLANPDVPFEQAVLAGADANRRAGSMAVRLWKHSRTSTVIEMELLVGGKVRPVICKRVPLRCWKERLAALFRPSSVVRGYLHGQGLRQRGLPSPRPLAVWHRCSWLGLPETGYLIQEKVLQAMDLHAYFLSLIKTPRAESFAKRCRVIDELARLLRILHRWQLSHRDLKAANILVSPQPWKLADRGVAEVAFDPLSEWPHVWFIDVDGLRKNTPLTQERRIRDLARLLVSFTGHPALTRCDCLRFLRSYLMRREYGRHSWKVWWRTIAQAAGQKIERNRRLGRVVG